jgi:pantoate--beta-alanine ligase
MTQVITSIHDWVLTWHRELGDKSIGFVPTMGALHAGHQSLIDYSRKDNDITVVSLFVNPTQFNDKNDFERYPRNDEKDISLLGQWGVDYIFMPVYHELYPDNYTYKVSESSFSTQMEGASRPGHFDGVLTVVMKLLNIIHPDRSYFGEKDFQQYSLISKMCEAFFMPIEIIMCPTVRDQDGLALSSRNALLTEEERKRAPLFHELLRSSLKAEEIVKKLNESGFRVDYVVDYENRRFGAVYLGNTRLIDNVLR